MSFQASNPHPSQRLPSHQPYFNQNMRSGHADLGLSSTSVNKMSGFFSNDRALPMYKDKPYFQPRRTAPRKQWRPLFVLTLCILALLWIYRSSLLSWGDTKPKGMKDRGEELWKWTQRLQQEGFAEKRIDWNDCREKVRDAFIVSFEGYEKEAWGYDEYRPVSGGKRNMVQGGLGWIIVDSLDTMIIMNLTSQVRHAREWIATSLRYNQDHDVNTFETTIRMLGGLLSAHYLSTHYPDLAPIADDDIGAAGEDLYIEKATDLADRLLGAFDSPSGIPYSSINLNTSEGIRSHDSGSASTAEATTVQLEFKYLAKLTGEAEYWQIAENVMQVVDAQNVPNGLVPIYINTETGEFVGNNIRLGSRGDSYYEYLIKQYLQTSEQEPIYKEMWDESLLGIRKHLLALSKNSQLMIIGERPQGIQNSLSPKMDHLVCFMPGTIALGATGGRPLAEARKLPGWSQQREGEILISREVMKTCWATYLKTAAGLAPEITHFVLDDPPVMMADKYPDVAAPDGGPVHELEGISLPLSPRNDGSEPWRDDLEIHRMDRHNLQRPETVESLFYMYRVTGDEIYRQWGWEMFKSFVQHTAVVEEIEKPALVDSTQNAGAVKTYRIKGFTSLGNADTIPPEKRDNMESFWMAETLKYFYLLFSDREFISLEEHVFNTEAHPLPRFKLGGDLKTGWQRGPRSQSI